MFVLTNHHLVLITLISLRLLVILLKTSLTWHNLLSYLKALISFLFWGNGGFHLGQILSTLSAYIGLSYIYAEWSKWFFSFKMFIKSINFVSHTFLLHVLWSMLHFACKEYIEHNEYNLKVLKYEKIKIIVAYCHTLVYSYYSYFA